MNRNDFMKMLTTYDIKEINEYIEAKGKKRRLIDIMYEVNSDEESPV